MAFLTATEIKTYLRIETTAEDTLIASLLVTATALAEGALGYALEAADAVEEFVDRGVPDPLFSGWRPVAILFVPGPIEDADDVVVTDKDDEEVEAEMYEVDTLSGIIRAVDGFEFSNGPYTIAAVVGLDVHPEFAAKFEAMFNSAVLQIVAHLYFNRNPSVRQETDEGGASRSIAPVTDGLPEIAREILQGLPRSQAAAGARI